MYDGGWRLFVIGYLSDFVKWFKNILWVFVCLLEKIKYSECDYSIL